MKLSSVLSFSRVVVASAFLAATSQAQVVLTEQAKLLANDGAMGDRFGVHVSLSGDTAIVGASWDDDHGSRSGSAYVFVCNGATWTQQAKLTATDGAAEDRFGRNVSVSGDIAIVGSYRDDDLGTDSGSAYVFVRTGTTWSQQAKLQASDGASGDEFGVCVSVSGDTAVVGACNDDENGTDSGSVYVFVRNGTAWTQQAKLLASDGSAGDTFGFIVALSGDTVAVSARCDDDNGNHSGSAYVFVRNGTAWTQEAKLLPNDGAAEDLFGDQLSLSGDTAVVVALLDDDNGTDSGSAYVFVRNGTTWTQQAKLLASDGSPNDAFGQGVSVNDDTAVVGAALDDENGNNSGSAYVFLRSGETWTQAAKLLPSDGASGDTFGNTVSLCGDMAVVGASLNDDNGTDSGSAYVFTFADCNGNGIPDFQDIAVGTSQDCNENEVPDECDIRAGTSLDANNNGIPDECECIAANYCLAAANSNGTAAQIGSNGETIISANSFVLTVEGAMPTQFGLFFYSDKQQMVFWGEGMLCIGPGVQRIFPILVSNSSGGASLLLDFTQPPFSSGPFAITPFSTWNFQYWYRDPLGGPVGFNFSDGLEVMFCP